MVKEGHSNFIASLGTGPGCIRFLFAVGFYLASGVYLYHGRVDHSNINHCFIVLNSIVAAVGCYLLSRRWVNSFAGSVLAGLVYGFSPYAFGLACYHPGAGVPFAMAGWLFCPAAFLDKWTTLGQRGFWKVFVTALISMLPFVVTALYYYLLALPQIGPFFPLPKNMKLELINFAGLTTPLAMEPHKFIISLFHIPGILCLFGIFMYYSSGRMWAAILAVVSICLGFCNAFFQIPPIVWGFAAMLFLSILTALGIGGMASAGTADVKWILACVMAAAGMAVVMLLANFRFHNNYFIQAALMYGIATVLTGSIFFIAKGRLRWHILRLIFLYTAAAIDIFITAEIIIGRIF
jgi:hypothetical protein